MHLHWFKDRFAKKTFPFKHPRIHAHLTLDSYLRNPSRKRLKIEGKPGKGKGSGNKIESHWQRLRGTSKSLTNLRVSRVGVATAGNTETQPPTVGANKRCRKMTERKSKTSHARVEATSAMTDSAHLVPQSKMSGSSHVNAIRVEWVHEGSWIFALEDQHTRRKKSLDEN